MHIVQIVIKNTSTLDFSLPILWALRNKHPKAKISILYTCLNKNQILREGNFANKFCHENAIKQYDLSDFLFIKNVFLAKLIRGIFSRSYSNKTGYREDKFAALFNLSSFFKSISLSFFYHIEKIISKFIVHIENVMPTLDPDLILFDNRSITNFYGRDIIYKYFESEKKPVVLLPHAPHYNGPSDEFCIFDEKNSCFMPEYTEHWMPFKYGEPWKAAPEHYNQFIKIGYPGLDSSWKDYIFANNQETTDTIRCLVLTRKFLSKNFSRPNNYDESTLDYYETYNFLKSLHDSIKDKGVCVEIIVKPHPSSSKDEIKKILNKIGFKNYKITFDLFYSILPNIDLVVAQFSTALVIPMSYNIPTVLVETKLQNSIHNRWPILADFYSNLRYYSLESELSSQISSIVSKFPNHKKNNHDYNFMRKFFDDNSIQIALDRVMIILDKYNGKN